MRRNPPVNFLCLSILSALLLSLTACSNGGQTPDPVYHDAFLVNNEITISDVANIPAGVTFDKVRVEITGADWAVVDAVEAAYEDGKAVLSLPELLSSEKLMKSMRSNAFDYEGFWPAEKTSDVSAKVAGFRDNNILAYDGDEVVGRIFLTDWEGTGPAEYKYFVYYHYADRPFTLSGYNLTVDGNRKSYLYTVSFRKGWNAYANVKAKEGDNPGPDVCTNAIPEDTQLYWRFEKY